MFDKQAFSELLKLAQGKRSINRFGQDALVDPAYISRLLRKKIENPPSALVVSKLVGSSEGRVYYEQLMSAAGYMQSTHAEGNISYYQVEPMSEDNWFKEVLNAPKGKQQALRQVWEIIRDL